MPKLRAKKDAKVLLDAAGYNPNDASGFDGLKGTGSRGYITAEDASAWIDAQDAPGINVDGDTEISPSETAIDSGALTEIREPYPDRLTPDARALMVELGLPEYDMMAAMEGETVINVGLVKWYQGIRANYGIKTREPAKEWSISPGAAKALKILRRQLGPNDVAEEKPGATHVILARFATPKAGNAARVVMNEGQCPKKYCKAMSAHLLELDLRF